MRMLRTVLVVIVCGAASAATAEAWTTPDGFFQVTIPSDSGLAGFTSPPTPFAGFWVSEDSTLKLAVRVLRIPSRVQLDQRSVEEGFAEEFGGSVARLPTRKVGALELWSMRTKSADSEVTQAVLRNEGKVYKLIAISNGAKPNTESIDAFLRSVQLVNPTSIPVTDINASPPGSRIDLHDLSKKAGGVAFLAIIALLIYRATKSKRASD